MQRIKSLCNQRYKKREVALLPLRLSIKWSEPRQNIIKQTLFCLPCAKGAGLRWRPLHKCAEAPTEPGGETVATQRVDGGIEKKLGHRVQAFFRRFSFFARRQYHRTAPTRKKTKFSSISRSLTACRNLLFGLFLHAEGIVENSTMPYFSA